MKLQAARFARVSAKAAGGFGLEVLGIADGRAKGLLSKYVRAVRKLPKRASPVKVKIVDDQLKHLDPVEACHVNQQVKLENALTALGGQALKLARSKGTWNSVDGPAAALLKTALQLQ
eukprot:794631-Amphidinium_carterae.1